MMSLGHPHYGWQRQRSRKKRRRAHRGTHYRESIQAINLAGLAMPASMTRVMQRARRDRAKEKRLRRIVRHSRRHS